MGGLLLFGVTVFLSAFLLFQVQPVIGKYILPWFGSSPGVWTTCLLFFQILLLGGYAYAHLLVSRLRPARQALVHGLFLLLAAVTLPITPDADWKPSGSEAPIGGILLVLGLSVGLPYLVLSTTGPLLQGWFARLNPGKSPYRLYALSNFGSLLALLSYPFLVERELRLTEQTSMWSWGYVIFALLAGVCAWRLYKGGTPRTVPEEREAADSRKPKGYTGGDVLLWFLLAAAASAMLLATTNQLCLDVAVVPFLWVLPLSLYLLSFVLAFDHPRWYVRPLFCAGLPLALMHVFGLLFQGVDAPIDDQILWLPLALFVVCMCCHGELARLKPEPRHLTFFFLVVSFGGACGGTFVAVGAPNLFNDFHEYPLLIGICSLLVTIVVFRQVMKRPPPPEDELSGRGLLEIIGWIVCFGAIGYATMRFYDVSAWVTKDISESTAAELEAFLQDVRSYALLPPLAFLVVMELARWFRRASIERWWGRHRIKYLAASGVVACTGLTALGGAVWRDVRETTDYLVRGRNFYGVLSITEDLPGTQWDDRTLKHGRIMHGFQYLKNPGWPTSYYSPGSGVGLAIRLHPERWTTGRSFRIGVVGLGTGTLASYANARLDPDTSFDDDYATPQPRSPGDAVHYYEINPMVVSWADEHFTFLSDARKRGADVHVHLGDARLVLERQLADDEAKALDVLAVDAFSSDAIPIHLLTKESVEIYWQHLKHDGILAIHVTNRYIDLIPVVHRLAKEVEKEVVWIEYFGNGRGTDSADWMLMTSNRAFLAKPEVKPMPLPEAGRLWTDDYSSVAEYVKWKNDDEEDGD